MKKEKVLGIYDDKIKTESGMKSITGNLIPKIGDYVYVDGNYILGGNRRRGKTTPSISTPSKKTFIELIKSVKKNMWKFRIIQLKDGKYKTLKEYEEFYLAIRNEERYYYDKFVYDENNICIYSKDGLCVAYKKKENRVRYYDDDILGWWYTAVAEYDNDDLIMWTFINWYNTSSDIYREPGQRIVIRGTDNGVRIYKNQKKIYQYNADAIIIEKLKSEFDSFIKELKNYTHATNEEIKFADGNIEVVIIKPLDKEVITRMMFFGRCEGYDDDYWTRCYMTKQYVSNIHGVIKKGKYGYEYRHSSIVKEDGDPKYNNLKYEKNNEFFKAKLNQNYNMIYPVNESYFYIDDIVNKKFGIKDTRTGIKYWLNQYVKKFGDNNDNYFMEKILKGNFVVNDIDENKILVISYANNTMHILNKEKLTFEKVIRPGGVIANQQYVYVDMDKAKSLISGFMKCIKGK